MRRIRMENNFPRKRQCLCMRKLRLHPDLLIDQPKCLSILKLELQVDKPSVLWDFVGDVHVVVAVTDDLEGGFGNEAKRNYWKDYGAPVKEEAWVGSLAFEDDFGLWLFLIVYHYWYTDFIVLLILRIKIHL